MQFRRAFLALTASVTFALAATGAGADGLGDRRSIKDGFAGATPIWGGFYVGAAVGYGFGTTELSGDGKTVDVDLGGAQGIVSAGYDFLVAPRTVFGVFADYAFGEVDGNYGVNSVKFSIDDQLAIGARLGYLVTPSTLLHASGGYTRADFEISEVNVQETLDGYFVGLGIEQALTRNLSLKLDYRFSNYEDLQLQDASADNETHSVRLGVSWHFGARDDGHRPLK